MRVQTKKKIIVLSRKISIQIHSSLSLDSNLRKKFRTEKIVTEWGENIMTIYDLDEELLYFIHL